MHPNTPEALDRAKKGSWLLAQQIFGFAYIQELRKAATDAEVIAYLGAS
jgi:hypothetical protein